MIASILMQRKSSRVKVVGKGFSGECPHVAPVVAEVVRDRKDNMKKQSKLPGTFFASNDFPYLCRI
jgi:hypothetical protein